MSSSTPSPNHNPGDDGNQPTSLIPPIVLGCIFGIFIVILATSLYCFCLRKKRCRHRNGKGEAPKVRQETTNSEAGKALQCQRAAVGSFNRNSMCPSIRPATEFVPLQRGSIEKRSEANEDAFNFMFPHDKQKLLPMHQRCSTLDRRRKDKDSPSKEPVLYKSLSSPCVMADDATDLGAVDTTALLQDCNMSELHDVVSDLDSSRVPLASSLFKDSYDPFCHSEPGDISFKELPGAREAKIEQPLELYSIEDDADTAGKPCDKSSHRKRSSSSKDAESYRKDSGNSKDADVSSSGTSDSPVKKEDTQPHDAKSSDSKSSGYSEGNGSSDNLETLSPISRFAPVPPRTDIGYHSDASSQQLSPLDFHTSKFVSPPRSRFPSVGHNVQVFSEDEANVLHSSPCRPKQPPSYTQAVVDIERMSERSDKTESEFDYLLEMERQLGVRISDTDDNNENPWTQRRYRHSVPRNYFSDTGHAASRHFRPEVGSHEQWNERGRYTEQEKTLRCNQLLEEFKTTRKSEGGMSRSPPHLLQRDTLRSPTHLDFKVMGDVIPEESRRRRNSANSATSTVNEWLV